MGSNPIIRPKNMNESNHENPSRSQNEIERLKDELEPILRAHVQIYGSTREVLLEERLQATTDETKREEIEDELETTKELDLDRVEEDLRRLVSKGRFQEMAAFLDLGVEYELGNNDELKRIIPLEEEVQEKLGDIPTDDLNQHEQGMRDMYHGYVKGLQSGREFVVSSSSLRDRLIENAGLQKAFTKDDFEEWIKNLLKAGEGLMQIKELSDEAKQKTQWPYKTFDRVYTGAPLSEREVEEVFNTIDLFLKKARENESDILSSYTLMGVGALPKRHPLDHYESDLDEAIQEVMKFRQFRSNVWKWIKSVDAQPNATGSHNL